MKTHIEQFFIERSKEYEYDQEEQGTLSLLRIACLGNPERTMQGELIAYLRSKKLFAISEGSFRANGLGPNPRTKNRHIDILVFDATHTHKVAIELKHFGANQGEITKLCERVTEDYEKIIEHVERIPLPAAVELIQVGLYTTVQDFELVNAGVLKRPQLSFYRYISAHVFPNNCSTPKLARRWDGTQNVAFEEWKQEKCGTESTKVQYQLAEEFILHQGKTQSFLVTDDDCHTCYRVTGRIDYFIGVACQPEADLPIFTEMQV